MIVKNNDQVRIQSIFPLIIHDHHDSQSINLCNESISLWQNGIVNIIYLSINPSYHRWVRMRDSRMEVVGFSKPL